MKICKSRAKYGEQEYAEVIISNALVKVDLIENVTFNNNRTSSAWSKSKKQSSSVS